MSKKSRKLLSLVLVTVLAAAVLAGCGNRSGAEETKAASASASTSDASSGSAKQESSTVSSPSQADKTLVIGVPANFEEKWNPFLAESAYDRQVIDQIFVSPTRLNAHNEVIPYAGNITSEMNVDGTVTYTVTVNEGMYFTNGDPVTIDDYIYFLYVCADPSYTGPMALVNQDIKGVKEYYYDDPNYAVSVGAFEKEAAAKYSQQTISQEDFMYYLVESRLEGWYTGLDAYDWIGYIEAEGFGDELQYIDPSDESQLLELLALVEYANYRDSYDPETWWAKHLAESYIAENLAGSEHVDTISGIIRIDDYTCTVTYNSVDINGDRNISVYLVPRGYYGDFKKGDVSKILANMDPVGSGPYVFQGFSDNIATCVANPDYFEGVPNIGTVKWQFVPENDTLPSIASGAIDIANPSGSMENIDEMQALGIEYDLIPFAGYGYAGFNCTNLDLYVRKGLFSLMDRQSSVKGYYGDVAQVIERPLVPTLAEYPVDATVYYPYSVENALKYFEQAGYTQKDGKLVDAEGKKLVVNAYIGGSGTGNHPAYAMLTSAAEDLATLGGELQINDVNFAVLQAAMNDGTADIFILAWGNVTNCDKRDQFRSTGGQNKYGIADAELDALLDEIVVTIDLEERKALVSEMLDRAMDLCIELPLYQRNDIIAYNVQTVDMSSLPEESTAFWNYASELWKLRMN